MLSSRPLSLRPITVLPLLRDLSQLDDLRPFLYFAVCVLVKNTPNMGRMTASQIQVGLGCREKFLCSIFPFPIPIQVRAAHPAIRRKAYSAFIEYLQPLLARYPPEPEAKSAKWDTSLVRQLLSAEARILDTAIKTATVAIKILDTEGMNVKPNAEL